MALLYSNNYDNQDKGFIGKVSLGGLPFVKPLCKIIPAETENINLRCDWGNKITEFYDIGFQPFFRNESDSQHWLNVSPFKALCMGDEFRNDKNYETDDKFACDRAVQNYMKSN